MLMGEPLVHARRLCHRLGRLYHHERRVAVSSHAFCVCHSTNTTGYRAFAFAAPPPAITTVTSFPPLFQGAKQDNEGYEGEDQHQDENGDDDDDESEDEDDDENLHEDEDDDGDDDEDDDDDEGEEEDETERRGSVARIQAWLNQLPDVFVWEP